MALDPKQIEGIKKQLLEQIETFPEPKRTENMEAIQGMTDVQLEEFLKANNLINPEGEKPASCPFCSIVFGDIPSTKIGENDVAIAVLEINPISKGHTLIIPKEHLDSPEKIPAQTQELAGEVSKKIKSIFNSKEIKIHTSNVFGHEIINLLPIYDNETMDSPRAQKTPEDLLKLKEEIEKGQGTQTPSPKEEEPKKEEEEINEKNRWLPIRIP